MIRKPDHVYTSDLRAADLGCWRTWPWFEFHGIDRRLLRTGIPCDVLLATGDAQALKVVEAVRGRQEQ